MKPIFLTAQKVQTAFESENWNFCFIGGVALQRWAIPRITNDVDLTLVTGFGDEKQFITRILADFEARIDDAANFALRNRVYPESSQSGGVQKAVILRLNSLYRVTPDNKQIQIISIFANRKAPESQV